MTTNMNGFVKMPGGRGAYKTAIISGDAYYISTDELNKWNAFNAEVHCDNVSAQLVNSAYGEYILDQSYDTEWEYGVIITSKYPIIEREDNPSTRKYTVKLTTSSGDVNLTITYAPYFCGYLIRYYPEDLIGSNSTYCYYGEWVTLMAVDQPGYRFLGWTRSTTPKPTSNILTTHILATAGNKCLGDMVPRFDGSAGRFIEYVDLYAILVETYTVSFETNGGSACESIEVDESNLNITLPSTSRGTNYRFGGWYDTPAFSSGSFVGNVGDSYTVDYTQTLYAKFDYLYSITFNLAGGDALPTNPRKVIYGETISLPSPTRSNSGQGASYIFVRWEDSSHNEVGGANAQYTHNIESNITLTAVWKLPCRIIYEKVLDDAQFVAEYTDTYQGETTILTYLSDATPETALHYDFDGWCTVQGDWSTYVGGTSWIAPDVSQITLYAHWTPNYEVTYESYNGTAQFKSYYSLKYPSSIRLPVQTKDYFQFIGWYTAEIGGDRIGVANEYYVPTGNITLHAHWKQIGGTTGGTEGAKWFVDPVGDKYNLTISFDKSYSSTANYTSATDSGNSALDPLPRWTAFQEYVENITSISIVVSGGVSNVKLGDYLFAGLESITQVLLNNGVSRIGKHTYEGCVNIRSIDVGTGMTEIGEAAFKGCTSVSTIELNQNVKTIAFEAFATTLDGDGNYLNEGKVMMVYVPSSVTTIAPHAFGGLKFKVDESSGEIDYTVVENFVGYTYSKSTSAPTLFRQSDWYVIHDANAETYTLYIAKTGQMSDYNPYGAPWYMEYPEATNPHPELITHVVLRIGVTSIGNYAFANLTGLKGATLPDTLLTIGNCAFAQSSIEALTIPDSTIAIANCAFQGCDKLSYLKIGDGVATIGDQAFDGCTNLTHLSIPIDLNITSPNMFDGMDNLDIIDITRGVSGVGTAYTTEYDNVSGTFTGSYTYTPWYKSRLNDRGLRITLEYGILSIGQATFFRNSGIISATIPESVISIGSYTFSRCENLADMKIPSNIKTIYAHTFEYCTAMASLEIGGAVTSIGDYAFTGCTRLTQVTIPSSVTNIGFHSFYGCTGMTRIIVGSSVSSIGNDILGDGDDSNTHDNSNAFEGCVNLLFVYNLSKLNIVAGSTTHGWVAFYAKRIYSSNETTITEFVIQDGFVFSKMEDGRFYIVGYNGTETDLVLPESFDYHGELISSYDIYDKAFINMTGLTSITLPQAVTAIGDSAFYGCSGITSFTFNENSNCKTLGDYALYGCTSLESIDLNGVRTIGAYAFSETGLTSVTIPASVSRIGNGAFMDLLANGSALTTVDFQSSASIPAYCFMGCDLLSSIVADSTQSIGPSAFEGCVRLGSITIADSVTSIGEDAFNRCSGLTSITIGDQVKTIDPLAFRDFTFRAGNTGMELNHTSLQGYTYTGGNYVFVRQANVFKFTIHYYLRGRTAPTYTESYTILTYATYCNLSDYSMDDNGITVRKVRDLTDEYSDGDGQTYSFSYWTTGKEGYTGARAIPGDPYSLLIDGVNEGEDNEMTLDLHTHYELNDNIEFSLTKYTKQNALKLTSGSKKLEWYEENGTRTLISLYETTAVTVSGDSTRYAPGSIVYAIFDSSGAWQYYYMGDNNEIAPNKDVPCTDTRYLKETRDVVGVTFDFSSCLIQSISRTIKANLTTIPTLIYGAENRFVIDLGTQMSYELTLIRVNPPGSQPLEGRTIRGETFKWVTAREMDWTLWYAIRYEVGFENLTNGDFYRLLLIFVDEWQNLLCNQNCKLTGGFQFRCSSIDTKEFNKILTRVFISGTIQSTITVQEMKLSIPLAVATMQTDDTSVDNVRVRAYAAQSTTGVSVSEKYVDYSYPIGTAIPVPLPQWEWEEYFYDKKKIFGGWAKSASSGITYYLGDTIVVTGPTTLYACWVDFISSGSTTEPTETPTGLITLDESPGTYTVEFQIVGAGGGGCRGFKYEDGLPLSWKREGGGGGGAGGSCVFQVNLTIRSDKSKSDGYKLYVGKGGTGSMGMYTGSFHSEYTCRATDAIDGEDTWIEIFIYNENTRKHESKCKVIAHGGTSAYGDGHEWELPGKGGECEILGDTSGAIQSSAFRGGDGGLGGRGRSRASESGKLPTTSGSLELYDKVKDKYGRGGNVKIVTEFYIDHSEGGGGGGGVANFCADGGKLLSIGADGADARGSAASTPAYGGGGGGSAYYDYDYLIDCYSKNASKGASGAEWHSVIRKV